MHTQDPKEEDCLKAQKFIDSAMKLSRSMGMSVTPKGHGGKKHLATQMRRVKGGLFEFDESWTEKYHQVGYKFDMKLRNHGSELRKALVRAKHDRRQSRPETHDAMKRLQLFKRGKRKSMETKEREKKRMKEER